MHEDSVRGMSHLSLSYFVERALQAARETRVMEALWGRHTQAHKQALTLARVHTHTHAHPRPRRGPPTSCSQPLPHAPLPPALVPSILPMGAAPGPEESWTPKAQFMLCWGWGAGGGPQPLPD